MRTQKLLLALIASTLCVQTALAQDRPAGPPDFLALGVGGNPEYVGSDTYQAIPFAAFRATTQFGTFRSNGLSVDLDLLAPHQARTGLRLEAGPLLNFRFGRDDEVAVAAVRALGEIDNAFELGGFAGIAADDLLADGDTISVRFDAAYDVSDVYSDWTYGLEATYSFATPRDWGADLVLNTAYGSDAFHDRYFSVSPAQSAGSGLRTYDASAGFYQVAIGTNIRRNLNAEWFVGGQFVSAFLIGDVADSPIVRDIGSDVQFRGGFFVGRTF